MGITPAKSVQISLMGMSTVFEGKTAKVIQVVLFVIGVVMLIKFLSKQNISINVG